MQDNKNETSPGKKIVEDFSFAQVIASALSAVTSVFLAPRIGVIGGIVGVFIGAAVAAGISQVYKSVLTASANKLKQNLGAAGSQASGAEPEAQPTQMVDSAPTTVMNGATKVMPTPTEAGTTEVMPQAAPVAGGAQTPESGQQIPGFKSYKEARTNPYQQSAKAYSRSAIVLLIVMCIAALCAVAASAAIIMKVTQGQGIGVKPPSITHIYQEEQQVPEKVTGNGQKNSLDANAQQDKASNKENAATSNEPQQNDKQATEKNAQNQTENSNNQSGTEQPSEGKSEEKLADKNGAATGNNANNSTTSSSENKSEAQNNQ